MTSYIFTIVDGTGRTLSSHWGVRHGAKPDASAVAQASDEYDPAWTWPTGPLASIGTTYTDTAWTATHGGFKWALVGDHAAFTKVTWQYDPAGIFPPTPNSKLLRRLYGAISPAIESGQGQGFTGQPVVLLGTLAGEYRERGGIGSQELLVEAVTLLWASTLHPTTMVPVGIPSVLDTNTATTTWLAANP